MQTHNEELFRKQRENWQSPLITDDIQSRGYWKLVIRPEGFEQDKIDFAQLYPLVRDNAVNLRSHSFPYVPPSGLPPPGEDWVGTEYSISWVVEAWRLYQSGQFIYIGGILDDWRDRMSFPLAEGWRPGVVISIEEIVYRCTEFFEFASRLALADAYSLDSKMHIEIWLNDLQDRALSVDPYKRLPIFRDYVTSAEHLHYSVQFTKEELVALSKKLALKPALEIFKRFNWNPSLDYLQGIQSEIGRTLGQE